MEKVYTWLKAPLQEGGNEMSPVVAYGKLVNGFKERMLGKHIKLPRFLTSFATTFFFLPDGHRLTCMIPKEMSKGCSLHAHEQDPSGRAPRERLHNKNKVVEDSTPEVISTN